MPSTQVVPAATAPMEVRDVEPPAPPTHIDQVVGELQTIEPAVQAPDAGAAGAAGAGADGAAGAADGF